MLLLCLGCSSTDPVEPVPLPPPAETRGEVVYPIELPAISAGQDDNFCLTVPLPSWDIGGSSWSFTARGVHHANSWASSAPEAPVARCASLPADYTIVGVWAPGTEALDLGGHALRLPSGATTISIAVHVLGPIPAGRVGEFKLTQALEGSPAAQYTQVRAAVPTMAPHTTASSEHGCALAKDATIITAWPHMHEAGRIFEVKLGAAPVVAVDWDVTRQLLYPVSVAGKAGDVLTIRCSWSNTTDAAIKLGPMVTDEMCVFGAIISPAGAMTEKCFAVGS